MPFSNTVPSILDQSITLRTLDDFAFDKATGNFPEFTSTSQTLYGPLKWFYTDIPTMYDPCVCLYDSKLSIVVNYLSNTTITLTGVLNGDAVSNGEGVNDGRSFSLSKTRAGRVLEAFNDADAFKAKEKDIAVTVNGNITNSVVTGIEDFSEEVKKNTFLQVGLSALPYAAAAMSIVDAFIGGGEESDKPISINPLAINLNASFNGTLNYDRQVLNVNLYTPGVIFPNNADISIKPDYIYPLGIFNVVDKITVNHSVKRVNTGQTVYGEPIYHVTDSYQVADPIRYVHNWASGLDIQEVKAQLIADRVQGTGGTFTEPGANPNVMATPLFDVPCIHNEIMKFKWSDPIAGSGGPFMGFKLKFFVNLKRKDATANTQNVLLVYTYPVTLAEVSDINQRVACTGDIAPVGKEDVIKFCTSNKYVNDARGTSRIGIEPLSYPDAVGSGFFQVFPNPAHNTLSITGRKVDLSASTIIVYDITGRALNIRIADAKPEKVSVDISDLAPGVYTLSISSSKGSFRQRISVQ